MCNRIDTTRMKNAIVVIIFLLTSSYALANMPTIVPVPNIVELSSKYKAEEVDVILTSIDYSQLGRDADESFPGLLKANIRFSFNSVTLHSTLQNPDHMAVLIFVSNAPPGWGKEAELKVFLGHYIEKLFPEPKTTTTTVQESRS